MASVEEQTLFTLSSNAIIISRKIEIHCSNFPDLLQVFKVLATKSKCDIKGKLLKLSPSIVVQFQEDGANVIDKKTSVVLKDKDFELLAKTVVNECLTKVLELNTFDSIVMQNFINILNVMESSERKRAVSHFRVGNAIAMDEMTDCVLKSSGITRKNSYLRLSTRNLFEKHINSVIFICYCFKFVETDSN